MRGEHTIATIKSRTNQNGMAMGAAIVVSLPGMSVMFQKAFSELVKVRSLKGIPRMGTLPMKSPKMMARSR